VRGCVAGEAATSHNNLLATTTTEADFYKTTVSNASIHNK